MQLRSLILVIAGCGIIYSCFGQSLSKPKTEPSEKTIYITKYDSNPPPLNFRSFGYKDGLPRGVVNDFVQTDDGFVWLGILKVGLVRFDGYHFKIFKPIAGDTTSFPDDYIFQIIKSHRNGLWIASVRGIIWFDLTSYKTKLIPLPEKFWPMFYHLFEDSQRRLWVFWEKQFYLYEPASNKFIEIKNRMATDAVSVKKVNIEDAVFYDVKESQDGDLFLLGSYLLKYNHTLSEFTVYQKEKNNVSDYKTSAFDEDKQNIWFSGWNGLKKYNYKNDSFLDYNFGKMGTQANIENHFFVSQKNTAQLWLPNEQQLRVFDKNTNKVSLYKKYNTENLSVTKSNAKGINGIEWLWDYRNGFAFIVNCFLVIIHPHPS